MRESSITSRLAGLALVLLGLAGSLLAGATMLLPWRTGFVVENRSGEASQVTPIGVLEGSDGRRAALPLQARGGLPAVDRGAFRIAPGATRRFAYDWDDVDVSELAVRRPNGPWHAMILRPGADSARCCSTLATDRVVVPALATLPMAPPAVAPAAETTRYDPLAMLAYASCLGPLVALLGLWLLFRASIQGEGVTRVRAPRVPEACPHSDPHARSSSP